MLNLNERTCPKCGTTKEKKEFGKDSTNVSGVSCWCKPCKKAWRAHHRKDNPSKMRDIDFNNDLKKHYGITSEKYWELFNKQGGLCACCGQSHELFKRRLHVDHDHTTGQVRGLLCTECNPGLGYFQDSIERLEMAITYLRKFKKLG
jgi:hypothetical protein